MANEKELQKALKNAFDVCFTTSDVLGNIIATETENTRLLALYKLLWEQIKDMELIYSLCFEVRDLNYNKIISFSDRCSLMRHLNLNLPDNKGTSVLNWNPDKQGTADRKAFVQRMIKELENDK